MSEGELISCVRDTGTTCHGGIVEKAYEHILSRGSLTEIQFPFEIARSSIRDIRDPCRRMSQDFEMSLAAPISGWRIVPEDSKQMKIAVVESGPISVHIKAPKKLQLYKSGVFGHKECSNESIVTVNHAMLVVGYSTDEKWGEYWILKNS